MDVFRSNALQSFEDKMVEHVKEFFPAHYHTIGPKNIRETIQYGYTQAKRYGLTTQRNVCLYINTMMVLGSNFNTDPMYPWAKETLQDKKIADPMKRVDQLCKKAEEVLEQISVSPHTYQHNVLADLIKNTDGVLKDALNYLQMIFPAKFEAVGPTNLQVMVKYGITSTAKYGIVAENNIMIYIFLMFLLGSGFNKDPQFSWARDVLEDSSINEQMKVSFLAQQAIIYLNDIS